MRKDVLSFRKRPLPDLSIARELRKGSRSYPIDLGHPLSRERLVPIGDYGIPGENYYHMESDNPPYNGRIKHSIPRILVRESVARRLFAVSEKLHGVDLELYGFDGVRRIAHQDHMFEEWMPAFLRGQHPDWDDDRIEEEVRVFWAKATDEDGVINPYSPPPHSTGGAVDLTLCDRKSKKLLNMGCGFDDFSHLHEAFTDHFEFLRMIGKHLTLDEQEALENRRVFYWAMTEEGFVMNPNEIWHAELYTLLWAALGFGGTAYYSIAFMPFPD